MAKSKNRAGISAARWLEYFLLGAGVSGVAVWAASILALAVYQDWQNWVFEREVAGRTANIAEYLAEKEEKLLRPPPRGPGVTSPPPRGESVKPPPVKARVPNNGLVGRISIPRLQLRAIVREGAGKDTLGLAVGHIPGTAFPGEAGNVGVAGHRDTLFRGLGSIRLNDVIQFETPRGSYLYHVESTGVVTPQDVAVLRPGPYPELTLVTCYPFHFIGSAPDRFIVTARQITGSAQASPEPIVAERPAPPKSAGEKIAFSVEEGHSRQLAPGISVGLTNTDVASGRANGWMWLMPDRRTIWLRNQKTDEPVVFYGSRDGKRRELRITRVARNSVSGYLLLSGAASSRF